MKKTEKIAHYGILIALAMILSYLESQIPAFFAVPGMKLGLTNLVVIFALFTIGEGAALISNLIRIFLVGILFGSGVSLIYSLAGGLLSGIGMILLHRFGRFHTVTISVAGGLLHNIGQIIAAMILMHTSAIAWYLLVLWFSGIVSGAVIGLIGAQVVGRLKPIM